MILLKTAREVPLTQQTLPKGARPFSRRVSPTQCPEKTG